LRFHKSKNSIQKIQQNINNFDDNTPKDIINKQKSLLKEEEENLKKNSSFRCKFYE
jgi:hypothetical protein